MEKDWLNQFEKLLSEYESQVKLKSGVNFRTPKSTISKVDDSIASARSKLIRYVINLVETKEDVEDVYYYDLQHEFGKPNGFHSGVELRKILSELLKKYSRVFVLANGVEEYIETSFVSEAFGGLIPVLGSRDEVMRRVVLYTLPVFNKKDNKIERLYETVMNNTVYNYYK